MVKVVRRSYVILTHALLGLYGKNGQTAQGHVVVALEHHDANAITGMQEKIVVVEGEDLKNATLKIVRYGYLGTHGHHVAQRAAKDHGRDPGFVQ